MAKIPFDIKYRPQIESGEYKVETRDGKKVRVLCYDANNSAPIVALVTFNDGSEGSRDYYSDGTMNSYKKTPLDLFIVTPEEELTPFEDRLAEIIVSSQGLYTFDACKDEAKRSASELLSLAREQFIKDGYVIEKKTFHDAVEKVDAKVKDEVSANIDLENFIAELGKRYSEVSFAKLTRIAKAAYDFGKADALKNLPRWKKVGADTGQIYLYTGFLRRQNYLEVDGHRIMLSELEKLPGFKEE